VKGTDIVYSESIKNSDLGYFFDEFRDELRSVFGPLPGEEKPVLMRNIYGETRWDKAKVKLDNLKHRIEWVYPEDPNAMGVKATIPRIKYFRGTALEPVFGYLEEHFEEMMNPRLTLYWGFFTHESKDSHYFGGIWPEILGTFYLAFGAMFFAVPMGIISAIYLVEYAGDSYAISLLRTCVSTLAGVPSIVFGLFGLAFFINSEFFSVSKNKSVLAGALTLGILVLPTLIRASEEAIRAVPRAYREAALSLGAPKFWTILTVIIPAALPGILTGIVISMGRAAGETAPIIFTAAVSLGKPLSLLETFSEPTPALSWNIYNLCSENVAAQHLKHVQYGMVTTLVLLVLALNLTAIILRARVSKKLKG
jgi:phosphate transport system permease protein